MRDAAAGHGVRIDVEQRPLARLALRRRGSIGSGRECDRRPTENRLRALVNSAWAGTRQPISVVRIIHFADATPMWEAGQHWPDGGGRIFP